MGNMQLGREFYQKTFEIANTTKTKCVCALLPLRWSLITQALRQAWTFRAPLMMAMHRLDEAFPQQISAIVPMRPWRKWAVPKLNASRKCCHFSESRNLGTLFKPKNSHMYFPLVWPVSTVFARMPWNRLSEEARDRGG